MAINALGRVSYPVPIAAGKSISMKQCNSVMFVCTGADTFTLKSQPTSGGTATDLAVITDYWTSTATDGSVALVAHTQAAGASVTISSGTVIFEVAAEDLPSGADYVEVTVASSGLVAASQHTLAVQAAPDKLAAPNA